MSAIEIETHDRRPPMRLRASFALLGLCAGLPFYLYTTILALRLARGGVDLTTIGIFAWIGLIPTLKFLWAPLVDRLGVPGFARVWGRRRGWILLAQLCVTASVAALAFADPAHDLRMAALWAVTLAFWATMLEIASDAWRIEVAPDAAAQGPIVAAYIWGYRGAMVAAGSGVLLIADRAGWTAGYLAIAGTSLTAFALLLTTRPDGPDGRGAELVIGLAAAAAAFILVAAAIAALGGAMLAAIGALGIDPRGNLAPWVLGAALVPFAVLTLALPAIRRMAPDTPIRRSAAVGPYIDLFWRYGFASLAILGFVALYRMGDVLALTLSKPFVASLGYSLTAIGIADGLVALAATIVGVGLGGWVAARWTAGRTLAAGAVLAAIGNFAFAWLGNRPTSSGALYLATAADQFGNGFAGAVFVVWLSLIVNPTFAAGQYALLSGFAFLLPRLIAGSAGAMVEAMGYPAFFLVSGALSVAAIALLPLVLRPRPRIAA